MEMPASNEGPRDWSPTYIAALGGGEWTNCPGEPPAEPGSQRPPSPGCPVFTPGL